jgi:hypothetical protein
MSPQYKDFGTGVDQNLPPNSAFMHYNELINSRNLASTNQGGITPEMQLRVSNTMKNEGKTMI